MNEGLAFMGVEASWALSHSALPDAPVVPDAPRRVRESGAVRSRVARALRHAAEVIEPPTVAVPGC